MSSLEDHLAAIDESTRVLDPDHSLLAQVKNIKAWLAEKDILMSDVLRKPELLQTLLKEGPHDESRLLLDYSLNMYNHLNPPAEPNTPNA